MMASLSAVELPRCPQDGTVLTSTTFQTRVGGKLKTHTAPFRFCRKCKRTYPRDDVELPE